jgi:hypothetical protein
VERSLDPIQEGDARLRPERLRSVAGDGFLGDARFRGHGAVVPFSLYFPWLRDEERELLLLARRLRPDDRRVLAELAATLGAREAAAEDEMPPVDPDIPGEPEAG